MQLQVSSFPYDYGGVLSSHGGSKNWHRYDTPCDIQLGVSISASHQLFSILAYCCAYCLPVWLGISLNAYSSTFFKSSCEISYSLHVLPKFLHLIDKALFLACLVHSVLIQLFNYSK